MICPALWLGSRRVDLRYHKNSTGSFRKGAIVTEVGTFRGKQLLNRVVGFLGAGSVGRPMGQI